MEMEISRSAESEVSGGRLTRQQLREGVGAVGGVEARHRHHLCPQLKGGRGTLFYGVWCPAGAEGVGGQGLTCGAELSCGKVWGGGSRRRRHQLRDGGIARWARWPRCPAEDVARGVAIRGMPPEPFAEANVLLLD